MTQQSNPNTTIVKYPRWLVVDAVVQSATSQGQTLTVPTDSDFEWWWLAAFRTSALMKVLIQETGTTRYFVYPQQGQPNQAGFSGIFIDLLAGLVANNGEFPVVVPYVMPASRSYAHQFTDTGSGAPNTVELAYMGYALLEIDSGS